MVEPQFKNLIPVNSSFQELIQSGKPVLVDFFAEWCGPCKMMKPILEEVKHEVGDAASIVKIDVDKNPGISAAMNIRGVPTLVLYKNGQVVWRKSGVVSADQLSELIKQHL